MAINWIMTAITAMILGFTVAWSLGAETRRRIEAPKYRPLKWK